MSTTMNQQPEKKKRVKKVIPSCDICVEPYNKSTRLLVKCPYCNYETCRTCCETYILNETEVKCMNPECAKVWTRKHIREIFTLVFINGPLKEHKEKVLFDKERALLPATQPIIEGKLLARKIDTEMLVLQRQISEINKQQRKLLQDKHAALNRKTSTDRTAFVRACPQEHCRGFLSSQWKCGICERWTCPDCHVLKGYTRDSVHTCNADDLATAKLISSDTKPCPQCGTGIFKIDGCFTENTPILLFDGSIKMSQDISVGDILIGDDGLQRTVLDTTNGVDEMFEVIQNKAVKYVVNSKHTLVLYLHDNIVEITVEDYIRLDETKQKLFEGYKKDGSRTSIQVNPVGQGKYYGWEIDGNHRFILPDFTVVRNCDQMWCTECHTAFSWRTGRKEQNIHNPHYYEWQRRNGGGQAPRNPGDVPCGRNLDHYLSDRFHRLLRTYYTTAPNYAPILTRVQRIIRWAIHLINVERPNPPNYEQKNENLRVQYLMKEITEQQMRDELQRDDKKHHKNQELAEVFTLLVNTVTDILYRFLDYLEQHKEKAVGNSADIDVSILTEIDRIVDYANECLGDISHTYSCSRFYIEYDLSILKGQRALDFIRELKKNQTPTDDKASDKASVNATEKAPTNSFIDSNNES